MRTLVLAISFLSKRSKYLEAVIGLIYALGLSEVFILLSKPAHGMEDFNNLMAYDILFTQMDEVYKTAILYTGIALAILIFEKKTKGRTKETLFFLTFALTVTSSVKLAGVLVVFAILLAPAFIAIQVSSIKKAPEFMKSCLLIVAWIIGIVINLLAIIISFYGDFPTGYSIVFLNAFSAVAISFIV